MGFLEANLHALRHRHPELAERLRLTQPGAEISVSAAATGAPAFAVDGRLETSREDPDDEARRLAETFLARAAEAGAVRLVIFGLGGSLLRHFADFDGRVLVVDTSPGLTRAMLEHVDLASALEHVDLLLIDQVAPALAHPAFKGSDRGLFLAHPAARRRSPELCDSLAARFHPGGAASPLDIAVIPPAFGGSLPVAQACVRALRRQGHRVRDPDLSPFWPAYQQIQQMTLDPRAAVSTPSLRAGLSRLIGETLLAHYRWDPPDLVFALAQAPLDGEMLREMRRLGIATAFWFCEDFRVMTYWEQLAPWLDVVFHVQPGDFDTALQQAGGFGVPLPMAFEPEIHRPVELDRMTRARFGSAFSTIGAGYYNRRCFLPGLFDLGLRVYGVDWPMNEVFLPQMPEPNKRQSAESSNAIFNATKVNLNLHSSPWTDGVNPMGDYLNPRTFEIAGAGAFQLVDARSELGNFFEIDREIVTFSSLEECRSKLQYYLAHEDERLEIAANGHARALAEHTFDHRMETAIDALRSGAAPLAPRNRSVPTAQTACAEATSADEPGLAQVLERLDPETPLDYAAFSQAIALGEGELSREEQVLMLMQEIRSETQVVAEVGPAT